MAEQGEYAICVATFYEDLAERLVNGATEAFAEHDVAPASVHTYEVPGAFELPLAAKLCAESGRFDGVACLGVVIRGETDHYDFVCAEAARGIQDVAAAHRRAVRVRRDHLRDPRAGRGASGRRQARPGPQRGARRAPDGASCAAHSERASPATITRPMAKVCHSCGKGPAFGNSRSHSMVATRRRFNPNLQKVRIDDCGRPAASTSAPAA